MKCALLILAVLAGVNAAAVPMTEVKDRLIEFSPDSAPIWLSEDEVLQAKLAGKTFMDITGFQDDNKGLKLTTFAAEVPATPAPLPSPGAKEDVVAPLIDKLSIPYMEESLTGLTKFGRRDYNDSNGRAAALWLGDRIKALNYGEVTTFNHSNWQQPTIIAHVPHTGDADAPTVILGSHTDSVIGVGADDNGSGVVTTLDVLRVLREAGYSTSTNALEFHFYSAEEQGLKGSGEVARKWKAEGRQVRGMLMADMTAWVPSGNKPRIVVIEDYVNANLTGFVRGLAKHYTTNVSITKEWCGYACSDHGSWHKQGYPAAHIWEGSGNNFIHSVKDTVNHTEWSWDLCREFAKVWLAYAVELTS